MTHSPSILFPAPVLRQLMEQLLSAAGCGVEAACVTADVLLEADLRGYPTHGLLRLPTMIQRLQTGMINPAAQPRIVTERAGSALVDADRSLGPVGALFGARLAAWKAKNAGTAAVGVVNGDHICMAGYYVEQIARAGCVGMITSVTQPLVHPLGGTERLLGTNPLAIAIPINGQDPLLLDFATSAIAYGSVLTAKARGDRLPSGVALGPDGNPTTDPGQAAQGALSPFAGHKGFGLCLFLGVLAGPMLGAKVGKPLGQAVREGHYDKGDLFVALDPSAFADPELFTEAVEAHLAEVKSCRKAPGVTEVRLPGERARAEKVRRLRAGVPIEAEVWREVVGIAGKLKVALPADHG
ncbi:MAG: Ldh family oxidoreductase [Deltaproteobacteria bacterium]|nr:Ldh family oxidoreductase [Deltaproteobacteria bacterium]